MALSFASGRAPTPPLLANHRRACRPELEALVAGQNREVVAGATGIGIVARGARQHSRLLPHRRDGTLA
jgi:hypothetical protein